MKKMSLTEWAENADNDTYHAVDLLLAADIAINSYATPIEDEVVGCTATQARERLAADPSLLWVWVESQGEADGIEWAEQQGYRIQWLPGDSLCNNGCEIEAGQRFGNDGHQHCAACLREYRRDDEREAALQARSEQEVF